MLSRSFFFFFFNFSQGPFPKIARKSPETTCTYRSALSIFWVVNSVWTQVSSQSSGSGSFIRVPTSSGNHRKPGKSLKKSSMHGKIMEFGKTWIIMEKSWNLWNNLTKPPVSRKLAVRHTNFVCLTASFLAAGGFKLKSFQNACMVYKHAVVAAFQIYAQRGEDAAKRGGWRPCVK